MEEILASIRRIIEDNDATASGQVGALPLRDLGSDESSQAEAPRRDVFEDAPPPAAESAAPPQPDEDPVPAAERAPVEQDFVPQGFAETRGEVEHFRAEFKAGDHSLRPVLPGDHAGSPLPQGGEEGPKTATDTVADWQPVRQELGPIAADHEDRKQSILSEYTGRKVAAAFGELNEAFEASRKRNLDQMAEEMLRPMLQEWLDNNLPTMVERLVREEIERVARGG
ncbi:hypothetical protein NA2_20522 [Nitratireductor pacificus pht-3B]|uniref:DUF2497 domain-containing protein n=2 Tax=Nitratireductor TaxID=245876 RepID=K2M4E6_9HYPH|nr:hypothetical protein NA2_20522 [Nitratireductor pacificus pht-3B]